MQVEWIKYYQCRMKRSNIGQSNPMQVKINLRQQFESFPNGWNQSHAGCSDWIKGVINQIQVESIKYRLNQSNTSTGPTDHTQYKWITMIITYWLDPSIKHQMQVEWIKYYQSNPMQLNINLSQIELFTYGWNHSHAGWNDWMKD